MKPQRWTVYSVLGDGNTFDVLTTTDPREALAKLEDEAQKYAHHRHHAHGIYDPDNEERGDVSDRCEEAALEMAHQYSNRALAVTK